MSRGQLLPSECDSTQCVCSRRPSRHDVVAVVAGMLVVNIGVGRRAAETPPMARALCADHSRETLGALTTSVAAITCAAVCPVTLAANRYCFARTTTVAGQPCPDGTQSPGGGAPCGLLLKERAALRLLYSEMGGATWTGAPLRGWSSTSDLADPCSKDPLLAWQGVQCSTSSGTHVV